MYIERLQSAIEARYGAMEKPAAALIKRLAQPMRDAKPLDISVLLGNLRFAKRRLAARNAMNAAAEKGMFTGRNGVAGIVERLNDGPGRRFTGIGPVDQIEKVTKGMSQEQLNRAYATLAELGDNATAKFYNTPKNDALTAWLKRNPSVSV